MTKEMDKTPFSKGRLIIGGLVFVLGFLSPLLVPLITKTEWSIPVKTTLSGLLIFGIPELFMIIAIAITGKEGFNFLKQRMFGFLRSFLAKDVSKFQYSIGLFMFFLPLVIGWVYPYIESHIGFTYKTEITLSISFDVIMLIGIFVLGIDFWEKLRSLFIYDFNTLKSKE